jgi:hypothetical protein
MNAMALTVTVPGWHRVCRKYHVNRRTRDFAFLRTPTVQKMDAPLSQLRYSFQALARPGGHSLREKLGLDVLYGFAERGRECPRLTDLLAETWFHRDPLTPLSAAAGNHLFAALGLHARAKAVLLGSLAPVGLECTLGHEK